MDVRCERCQSEYEVEDAHVSDLGTEVQCSDCGHLFVVKRPGSAAKPVKASPSPDGEEAGTWVIETAAGRSLRLRDLTTLHKWIIERRVGRQDRLSRSGAPWQRLGEMADLAPFFDIVDSAERARVDPPAPVALPAPLAVPTLEPPPRPPAPARSSVGRTRGRPSSVFTSSAKERIAAALRSPSLYDGDADETVIVRTDAPKRRGILKFVVAMLVAAVVAYAGILWQHHGLHSAMISSSGTAESPAPPKVAEAPSPTPSAPAAAENSAVAEDSAEGSGSPARGPRVERIADDGIREKVPLLGSKRAVQAKPVAGRKAKGQATAHAQGSQVSAGKGNAPPALAAQGYVALNHRQPSKAIALFKRALASSPNNGTALFGLAEAYRTANQYPAALQAYRRYIELLPSGPDAGSARFQIRTLENKKR
jgi:predicted Zn finger-like uncharacterized protein